MSNENKSTVFALNKEDKQEAIKAIKSGIQQMIWQKMYVEAQVDALPELPKDATDEMKQERAKRRVQVDAIDKKVDDQIEFYNFCNLDI